MFEKLTFNQIYDAIDYFHIDLSVTGLRGSKLHREVRFKLFVEKGAPGLEFRNSPEWPRMFPVWPGKSEDQHGPIFRICALEPNTRLKAGLDSESITLIADITAGLSPIITSIVDAHSKEIGDKALIFKRQVPVLAEYLSRTLGLNPIKVVEAAPTRSGAPIPNSAGAPAPAAKAEPAQLARANSPEVVPRPIAPPTAVRLPEYVVKVIEEYISVRLELVKLSDRPMPDCWSPIVISVVKDEFDCLFDFLRHHRTAGIERFIFIDNGSTDGTLEFLVSQPDVDVYLRRGRFDWMLKQGWINKAISLYGLGRWYIYLDADEHLVFDGVGERTLRDLARIMESRNIFRVRGLMIDMYTDGPLLESDYASHGRLIDAYPFFDRDTYKEEKHKEIISVKGGPRTRVFGRSDPKFRPELTKYPLFKLRKGEFMVNPHHIWPYDGNFISDRYIGVLHFKFLPSLARKIKKAIEEESYWDGSFEYKCYAKVLDDDPKLSLICGSSTRCEMLTGHGPLDLLARVGWDEPPSRHISLRSAYLQSRAGMDSDEGLSRFQLRKREPDISPSRAAAVSRHSAALRQTAGR